MAWPATWMASAAALCLTPGSSAQRAYARAATCIVLHWPQQLLLLLQLHACGTAQQQAQQADMSCAVPRTLGAAAGHCRRMAKSGNMGR